MAEIKLEINMEYDIELYPEVSMVKARYVGETKLTHDFVYEDESGMGVIIMNKYLIEERVNDSKRILTYNQFSSSSVAKIPADEIEKDSSLTKLMFGGMISNG